MSKKIPFLEMFAALRQWTEFVNAMSGWKIVEAAIDRASRSAEVTVEGAAGAGPNLIAQAEEAVCKCYGLSHVKLNCLADTPAQTEPPKPEKQPVSEPEQPAQAKEPERTGEPEAAKAKTYTVKAGDCLWNIAKQLYGKGSDYTKIYNANKGTIGSNPNLIYPGQVFTIP